MEALTYMGITLPHSRHERIPTNTMTPVQLFKPLENIGSADEVCFLSGDDLPAKETLSVFPEWLMERFELHDKQFKLMDRSKQLPYKDLTLPCSPTVKQAFDELELEVKAAFEGGYEAIKALDPHKLFIWVGKITYGALYHDLRIEMQASKKRGLDANLSAALKERLGLFHLMLRSFIDPITFVGDLRPWSTTIVRLKYSKDIFNYRDDPVNLIFSLGMNGFGIITCLLDNGTVSKEHQRLIEMIGDTVLHPIQFEELCARMQYSAYLLARKPTYLTRETGTGLEIKAQPIVEDGKTPVFKPWDDGAFATVLAGYFKPWGLSSKDIHRPPNAPISFLENEVNYEFIPPESIKLPF